MSAPTAAAAVHVVGYGGGRRRWRKGVVVVPAVPAAAALGAEATGDARGVGRARGCSECGWDGVQGGGGYIVRTNVLGWWGSVTCVAQWERAPPATPSRYGAVLGTAPWRVAATGPAPSRIRDAVAPAHHHRPGWSTPAQRVVVAASLPRDSRSRKLQLDRLRTPHWVPDVSLRANSPVAIFPSLVYPLSALSSTRPTPLGPRPSAPR